MNTRQLYRFCFIAAALLTFAAVRCATAATRYCGPGGNDNNDGSTYALRWATWTKANADLQPGDVCYATPGTHTGTPNPANTGSSPTGNGRITIIGYSLLGDCFTNQTARDQVRFANGAITRPYLTIYAVHVNASLDLQDAGDRDSIGWCTYDGDMYVNGDYSTVTRCEFRGQRIAIGRYVALGSVTVSDTMTWNRFPNLGQGVAFSCTDPGDGGESIEQWGLTQAAGGSWARVDSCVYENNWRKITMDPCSMDTHPRIMFYTRYTRQTGNRLDLTLNCTPKWQYALRIRDSSYRDTLVRDTIIVTAGSPGKCWIGISTSGRSDWVNGVFETVVDSCFWNLSAAGGGSYTVFQDHMTNVKLTHNTIVTKGNALRAWDINGKNTVQFNTLCSTGGYVCDFSSDNSPGFGGAYTDTALIFRYNIVYNGHSPTRPDPFPGTQTGCVKFFTADFDSGMATTQKHAQRRLVANNNLYSYYGYATRVGDRSVNGYRNTTVAGGPSARAGWCGNQPGDSTATNMDSYENVFGVDSLSVYGSPQFDQGNSDSLLTEDFNPMISMDSPARGIATGTADAGAVSYPTTPLMSTSPAYVLFQPDLFGTSNVFITNIGDGVLHVSSCTIGSNFTLSGVPTTVAAGSSATIGVTYVAGGRTTFLTVVSDDPLTPTLKIPIIVSSQEGGEFEP